MTAGAGKASWQRRPPDTRRATPLRTLSKTSKPKEKFDVVSQPPTCAGLCSTDTKLEHITTHSRILSSILQWSWTLESEAAQMSPEAATAGIPIPGKVESPTQ